MGKKLDLVGNRYSRLVVIEEASRNKHRQVLWSCRCDCDNETIVPASNLVRGFTRSCGCLFTEELVRRAPKHVESRTKLCRVWYDMKRRCNNPAYKHYGGRGIIVCDEWEADFPAFEKWALSNGYKEGLAIHRIDNDGNYEPDNCEFLTCSAHSSLHMIARYKVGNGLHDQKMAKGRNKKCES